MDGKAVLAIITIVVEGVEIVLKGAKLVGDAFKDKYGPIRERTPATINEEKGFLIWDYLLYNEITFKSDQGEIWSFFTSFSDSETRKVWDELKERYGVSSEV